MRRGVATPTRHRTEGESPLLSRDPRCVRARALQYARTRRTKLLRRARRYAARAATTAPEAERAYYTGAVTVIDQVLTARGITTTEGTSH
jgi:hypothetical protein